MGEDQFRKWEGYLTIGPVHEKLKTNGVSVPIPTIRNWVNELHQLQVHTLPRNQRGERIFSEIDVEIIRFIHEAKKRFGNNMTMEAIAPMIQEQERFKEHLYYDPMDGEGEGGPNPVLAEHRIREFLKTELEQLNELKVEMLKAKETMQESAEKYKEILLLQPDPEEEKKQKMIEMRTMVVDAHFRERKVIARLREQAEAEWNKNPVKKGLIFKTEDSAAKMIFIETYIDKHYENEMKKETES